MKFSYHNPTRILFGEGQIAALAKQIPAGEKVLVIYGGGSIKQNGVYQQLSQTLAEHNWIEFSGVEPNPTVETLDKAVALVREQQVSLIVAVGGGSVIDGSKYVAAAAKYDGDGWDILEGKHRVTEAVPLGVVLTLPATGSESNGGSVITRASTQEKRAFGSPAVHPQFAVMDPAVMKTLPLRQLQNGLVDAFVHVCEQYLTTPQGAMVQDGYAEALLKNLVTLAADFSNHDSDQWRANLMWTANQALNGMIGSGVSQDWATHMIGHELTAFWGIDHARTLAIIQPALLREIIEEKRQKLEQMGQNVFNLNVTPDLAEQTINRIEALYHSLDINTRLADQIGETENPVEMVITALEQHGMVKLGDLGSITPDVSRRIVQRAL
mgnify:CR=1 FL=1